MAVDARGARWVRRRAHEVGPERLRSTFVANSPITTFWGVVAKPEPRIGRWGKWEASAERTLTARPVWEVCDRRVEYVRLRRDQLTSRMILIY
jgi:hypothetical protein